MADELLRKRLLELARRAYDKGIYTYTDFLSMAEIAEFRAVERQMVCFGSKELCGYSELPPICCLEARPLNQKFADKLTHRDFLGSLMGLGIKCGESITFTLDGADEDAAAAALEAFLKENL